MRERRESFGKNGDWLKRHSPAGITNSAIVNQKPIGTLTVTKATSSGISSTSKIGHAKVSSRVLLFARVSGAHRAQLFWKTKEPRRARPRCAIGFRS